MSTMLSAAVRRRRPEQGGYACGEETRARIIATALRVFGEHGYDQASTRQIAAEAGVNPPALQYYFDGKEGLHRACAEYLIEVATASLSPALNRAKQAALARDKAEAADALCGLLDALTDTLVAVGSEGWSRFIVRGKADGAGPALGILRERIGAPLIELMCQLVCIVTGQPPEGDSIRVRVLTLLGQVNWFHANRDNALLIMGWREFDQDKVALIKSVVREHTRAALRSVPQRAGAKRPRDPKPPRRR
jgi:AcrR family transcriptional regulator